MMLKIHLSSGIFLLIILGLCQQATVSSGQETTTSTQADTTPVPKPAEQTDSPKTCPRPSAPVNGKVVYISDNTRLPGSKVKFECNDGYVLNGDDTWKCSAEATWPNVTAPSCEKIECGILTEPENGKVSYKYASNNITATFTCQEDFTLEGSSVRNCVNKKWTGEEAKCTSGKSNIVVIIIVVILVVIVVCALVAVAVYFYTKKRSSRSQEVTRPASGAYQAVETKATGGESTDVEMASKPETADEEKEK